MSQCILKLLPSVSEKCGIYKMLAGNDMTKFRNGGHLCTHCNTPYKGRCRSANQMRHSERLFLSVISILHALSLVPSQLGRKSNGLMVFEEREGCRVVINW